MKFSELEAFTEVCKCRNITEASRRLFISQPALSRQIRDLENELGVKLFERTNKGIEVTEHGKKLYADAARLLYEQQLFTLKAQGMQKFEDGSMSIGILAPNHIPIKPLINTISRMSRKNPNVSYNFKTYFVIDFNDAFETEKLDLLLCTKAEVDGYDNIDYEVISHNVMSCLVGRGHRLWGRDEIYIDELAGEDIAVYQSALQNTLSYMTRCLRQNCPSVKSIFKCSSIEETLCYVASGRALSLSGMVTSENIFCYPDIIQDIPFAVFELDWGWNVAVVNRGNPFVNEFTECLKEEYAANIGFVP